MENTEEPKPKMPRTNNGGSLTASIDVSQLIEQNTRAITLLEVVRTNQTETNAVITSVLVELKAATNTIAVLQEREAQIAAVNEVLKEIGADGIPQVLVYNKIDLTAFEPRVESDPYGKIQRVWISAKNAAGGSQGLDLLRNSLGQIAEAALRPEAGAALVS